MAFAATWLKKKRPRDDDMKAREKAVNRLSHEMLTGANNKTRGSNASSSSARFSGKHTRDSTDSSGRQPISVTTSNKSIMSKVASAGMTKVNSLRNSASPAQYVGSGGAGTLVQSINKRLARTQTREKLDQMKFEDEQSMKKLVRSLTKDSERAIAWKAPPANSFALGSDTVFRDLIRQVADEHERRLRELKDLMAEVEELRSTIGNTTKQPLSCRSAGKAHFAQDDPSSVIKKVSLLVDSSASDPPSPGLAGTQISPNPAEAAHHLAEQMELVLEKEMSLKSYESHFPYKPSSTGYWMSPSGGHRGADPALKESYGDLDAPDPDMMRPEGSGQRGSISNEVILDGGEDFGQHQEPVLIGGESRMYGDVGFSVTVGSTGSASPATRESENRTRFSEPVVQGGTGHRDRESLESRTSFESSKKRRTRTWSSAVQQMAQVATDYFSGGDMATRKARKTRKREVVGTTSFSESFLQRAVNHVSFEAFFALIIFLNAGFIGAEIEVKASNPSHPSAGFFEIAHYVFSVLFLIEMTLRIWVMRCDLFYDRDAAWHMIDILLLVHSAIEFVIGCFNGFSVEENKNVRLVRVVRVVRNVRIVRVMRLVGELRTMLYAIFGCFRALLGLICLLVLILYFFAVFFTQGVTEYRADMIAEGSLADERLKEFYGTIVLAMYTLYKAMTAGVAWGDVLEPLGTKMHWFYVILFLCFISFALFAVLNVVTGVFVESALRRTQEEEDNRLEEEARIRSNTVCKIRDLFSEIDADQSGTVSIEEFMDALNDEYVMGCFDLLDIETSEAEQLFHLLDPDSEGTVEIEEFVKGCLRLKGEAKSIDIAILMCENRRLMHKFHAFMGFVAAHFDRLESYHELYYYSTEEVNGIDDLMTASTDTDMDPGMVAGGDSIKGGSSSGGSESLAKKASRMRPTINRRLNESKAYLEGFQKEFLDDAASQSRGKSQYSKDGAMAEAEMIINPRAQQSRVTRSAGPNDS